MGDLGTIGAGLMAIITGALGWWAGRGKREVTAAEQQAQINVVNLMRDEVTRLSARVKALETHDSVNRSRIHQLEIALVKAGVPIPEPITKPAKFMLPDDGA